MTWRETQDIEHPDVRRAGQTGWPSWIEGENADTPEEQRKFIEEYMKEFLDFIEAEYSDILERFFEHYEREYKEFLN